VSVETKIPTSVLAMELALAMSRLRSRLRNEQAAVTTGRNMSQLSVLGRISDMGPVAASALAQAEHVRQQSISETVAALRKDGLVRGDPDPSDGRKTLLTLTPAGKELVESIVESRGSWLARAIEQQASEPERELLAAATAVLSRLADCQLETPTPVGWRI
jgi:DNA-binding MarR family transcriptional regulator